MTDREVGIRAHRSPLSTVPDLPGCIATGATREKVQALIREAIEFHLEGMRLHNESVPEPTVEAGLVEVTFSDA